MDPNTPREVEATGAKPVAGESPHTRNTTAAPGEPARAHRNDEGQPSQP